MLFGVITRLNLVCTIGTKQHSDVFFDQDYGKEYHLINSHKLFHKQPVYKQLALALQFSGPNPLSLSYNKNYRLSNS